MDAVANNEIRIFIDKIKIGIRFALNEMFGVNLINDVMQEYVRSNRGEYVKAKRYFGTNTKPKRCLVKLDGYLYSSITVETGCVAIKGNHRNMAPYVTYEFNYNKIYSSERSYVALLLAMDDLLPWGGYSELIENGFVYYIEIAIDFINANMHKIEAFSQELEAGERYCSQRGEPETIYLTTPKNGHPTICIYDKRLQAKKKTSRLYRRPRLRVEARLRLNKCERLRTIKFCELGERLPNLFRGLQLFDRQLLETTFRTKRHANFVRQIASNGLQSALDGRDNKDRRQRIRMLQNAAVPWWDSDQLWEDSKDYLRFLGVQHSLA